MGLKISVWTLWLLIISLGLMAFILLGYVLYHDAYLTTSFSSKPDLASKFGSYFGGLLGTLFAATSTFLIIVTIIKQHIDNKKKATVDNFFKMLDYHTENVKQLSIKHINPNKQNDKSEGRRAFVIFKLQINELLKIINEVNNQLTEKLTDKQVIDIAYIIFYYGLDEDWIDFTKSKLAKYSKTEDIFTLLYDKIKDNPMKLGRTNQTSVSSYFRNMYNAIKLIDSDETLNDKEKKRYVKILRAQLSNPELYVLFFNILSRFGKKWASNEYVDRYSFLKNLPRNYTPPYDPKKFFNIEYEEDELS